MTIQQREPVRLNGSVQVPTLPLADAPPARGAAVTSITAKFLAVFRVAVGFVFLWAFLDKTFGLGYATPSAKAWINGGSPTKGFLSGVAAGPLESTFHSWAGAPWADWLFMAGLLGIGLALTLGVALRIAAASGSSSATAGCSDRGPASVATRLVSGGYGHARRQCSATSTVE